MNGKPSKIVASRMVLRKDEFMKPRFNLRALFVVVAVCCMVASGWTGFWNWRIKQSTLDMKRALEKWKAIVVVPNEDKEGVVAEARARQEYFEHKQILDDAMRFAWWQRD